MKTFVTFVIPRECLKSKTVDQLSVAEIVGGALFTRFFFTLILFIDYVSLLIYNIIKDG